MAPLTVAYATGFAPTTLPLPAGGIGGVYAVCPHHGRRTAEHSSARHLGRRAFSFWLPIVPAAMAVRSLKRLHDDLPVVEHPVAAQRVTGA